MEKTIRYPLGILTLPLIILFSCKKDSNPESNKPDPVIRSIHPAVTAPGGTVIINGDHFTSDPDLVKVKINNSMTSVSYADSGEIVIQVPDDAASGKLSVTIDRKTATSASDLIINSSAPLISRVAPTIAAIGDVVSISGKNFKENLTVSIGDKSMEAQDITATSFKISLPEGSTNGRITVMNNGMTAISPNLLYTPARLVSLSSLTGKDGDTITINGENFALRQKDIKIFFGESPATTEDVVSISATAIKVKAPVSGTNGPLRIEQFGTISNSLSFNYVPSITSFEPELAEPGNIVVIKGHRFGEGNRAYINGVQAEVLEISPASISIKVPAGASTGKVEVRSGNKVVAAANNIQIFNIWKNINVAAPFNMQGRSVFVIGSKAYFSSIYNIHVFDINTLTWTEGHPRPSAYEGRHAEVAIVKDGKAYIGTGGYYENGRNLKDWWVFDPSLENPWTRLTDFPVPTSFAAGLMNDNKIYVGLGQTMNPEPSRNVYPFNPEGNGSWGEPISVSGLHSVPNMSFTINSIPYFGMGQGLYKFEPEATNPITRVADFPVENYAGYVSHQKFASIGSKGYIHTNGKFFSFDPVSATWAELTSTSLSYEGRIASINNRLILFDRTSVKEYIPRPE